MWNKWISVHFDNLGSGCGCLVVIFLCAVLFLVPWISTAPSVAIEQLTSDAYSIESRVAYAFSIAVGFIVLAGFSWRWKSQEGFWHVFADCEGVSVFSFSITHFLSSIIVSNVGTSENLLLLFLGALVLGVGLFTLPALIAAALIAAKR